MSVVISEGSQIFPSVTVGETECLAIGLVHYCSLWPQCDRSSTTEARSKQGPASVSDPVRVRCRGSVATAPHRGRNPGAFRQTTTTDSSSTIKENCHVCSSSRFVGSCGDHSQLRLRGTTSADKAQRSIQCVQESNGESSCTCTQTSYPAATWSTATASAH